MSEIVTCFKLKMKDEKQIPQVFERLNTVIEGSQEDEYVLEQITSFLAEMKESVDGKIVEVENSCELSEYAYELLFPEWYKAIAQQFPDGSFSADAFQKSYDDGSTYTYKANYSKGMLTIKRRMKGYTDVEPKCEGVISIDELKDFTFDLNEIKEQPALKANNIVTKTGAVVTKGVLKKYVGENVDFIVPDDVTAIAAKAFCGCIALKKIHISANVVKIPTNAICDCPNLEEITVAEENVVYQSINNCLIQKSNKKLIMGCKGSIIPTNGSVKTIADEAFANGVPDSIDIPKDVTKLPWMFVGKGIKHIAVESGNKKYHSAGDCLIETKSKNLILGCANSVIPDDGSVEVIGESAFENCSSLSSIIIPNGVTEIGDLAFRDCSGLSSIIIPNSVTKIGRCAFANCSSLSSIIIPNGVTEIGWCAFDNCSSLSSIIIPNGETEIGDSAFENCSSLSSITIPNSVTKIGRSAFENCRSLSSIIIPNGVTEIGEASFMDCSSLSSIIIPNGVTKIGRSAFMNCSSLSSIIIPNGVTEIGDSAFENCSNLSSIIIPNGVTEIGESAFENCSSLSSIIIPNGVTTIGEASFANCSSLSSITIPNSVTKIGCYAFKGCKKIIQTEEGVSYVDKWVMECNETLVEVVLRNDTEGICDLAFYGCKNLKSIVVPDNVKHIGNGAFEDCISLSSITIPNSVTKIGDLAFRECSGLSSIIIPNGVTEIGSGAFEDCISLSSITIPNSVTKIGVAAFKGCKKLIQTEEGVSYVDKWVMECNETLVEVVLRNDTEGICDVAFYGCKNLKSIVVPDNVKHIDAASFMNCISLSSIIIPNGVTEIGDGTFMKCSSLSSVIIPNSVTKIGCYAFEDCGELSKVFYMGDEKQWNSISIDSDNDQLIETTRYYYTENEPDFNSAGAEYNGKYWHYDADGVSPVIWKKGN